MATSCFGISPPLYPGPAVSRACCCDANPEHNRLAGVQAAAVGERGVSSTYCGMALVRASGFKYSAYAVLDVRRESLTSVG